MKTEKGKYSAQDLRELRQALYMARLLRDNISYEEILHEMNVEGDPTIISKVLSNPRASRRILSTIIDFIKQTDPTIISRYPGNPILHSTTSPQKLTGELKL